MALRLSKSKSFNEPKQPPIPEMSKLPVSKTQAEYLAEARQIFIDNYREKIIGELLVSVAAPPPPAIGDNYGSVTSSAVSSIDKLSSIAEYPTDTDSQSEDQPADGENSFKPSTQRSHRKLRSQITTPPPPVPVDPRRHAKLVLKSGDVYEGQVLLEDGGVMDGYGSLQWSDGQRYEGQFLANKITGKGRYFWSDGFDYIGELLNGRRHGQGRWSSAIHNLLAEGSWQHGGLSGYVRSTCQ
jgi:hypothetical protein